MVGQSEDAGNHPLAPPGVKLEEPTPKLTFPIGRKELVWAEDIEYFITMLRVERWSLDYMLQQSVQNSSKEESLCQIVTFLIENEFTSIQQFSNFLPKISCYYAQPRTALAYIIRDEAKHSEGLLWRLERGGGAQKSSAATQYALKSVAEINDFTTFMFIVGILGKAALSSMTRILSTRMYDDVLGQLLSHISLDEELHTSFAASHIRHRLKHNPSYVRTLEEMVDRFELYLLSATGVDEQNQAALLDILGRDAVREMLAAIDDTRKTRLLEAGLTSEMAERMMKRITAEKTGIC